MESKDDKTERDPIKHKNVNDMTREQRRKYIKEIFDRIVERNGDALTRLSKK